MYLTLCFLPNKPLRLCYVSSDLVKVWKYIRMSTGKSYNKIRHWLSNWYKRGEIEVWSSVWHPSIIQQRSICMIIYTQITNYSTGGMVINAEDTNYCNGGMVINAEDTNYSTGGMVINAEDTNYCNGGMVINSWHLVLHLKDVYLHFWQKSLHKRHIWIWPKSHNFTFVIA